MKKFFLIPLVLLLAFSYQESPGKLKWLHDYDEGLKLAKEQGKPIFVYFGWKG
jgi:hypothetical protein